MSVWQARSSIARAALVHASRDLRRRQTKSEQILWQALRNRKIDGKKFRRQARIGHYVVDFYCPSERLVIEIDGEVHDQQTVRDRDRQELLEDLGMRVVRITAKDCEDNLRSVLARIRTELRRRAPAPRSLSLGEGEGGRKAG